MLEEKTTPSAQARRGTHFFMGPPAPATKGPRHLDCSQVQITLYGRMGAHVGRLEA